MENIIDDFNADYHAYMLDQNNKKSPEYFGNGLHVSTIGYCKRRTVYEYFGFEKRVLPLTTLTTFARGNDVHHEVQSMLGVASNFHVLAVELNVSEGLPEGVKGKLDFIVEHIPTSLKVLIDVKSANPHMFKSFSKSLPKPDHMLQVTHYANACDKLEIPYDRLAIVYLDKGGTNKSRMYFFDEVAEAGNIMSDDLEVIADYKADKTIPEFHLTEKEEWKCSYCNYYNIVCGGKP